MQINGKRGGEIGAEKEKRTGELEGEPNSSEQTIEDKLFVYRKKHAKWCQLSERKELSITAIKKAWKAANRQIKDTIAVSYFFFARTSALVPRRFAARSLRVLTISTVIQRKIRDFSQDHTYIA